MAATSVMFDLPLAVDTFAYPSSFVLNLTRYSVLNLHPAYLI